MVGGISLGGLASGLDTNAIIEAILAAERVPIQLMEQRKAAEQKKITLLGTFQGHVSALRDKAAQLGTASGFLSFKVDSSHPELASISASSAVSAGAHTLVVQSLMSTDRWAFDGVDDPDRDLSNNNGNRISYSYRGQTYDFRSIDRDASSLNDLAATINAGPNGGVRADVVQTGVPGAPDAFQLVLTAADGGADDRISAITTNVPGLSIDSRGPDANGNAQSANNITVGNYARFVLDGLQFVRDSNTVSDVLDGVAIDLLGADPNQPVSFTVSADKEAIKGRIQEFVDAYNEVAKFISAQNTYSETTGPGGPLFGDNALSTIRNVLSRTLFSQSVGQVQADPGGYGSLRLLGIETNQDGTLRINGSVMDAKMDADLDAFADYFVDHDGFDNGGAAPGTPRFYFDQTPDTGLGDDLMRAIDQVVRGFTNQSGATYAGLFDSRKEALNGRIKNLDKTIDSRQQRLARLEEQLVARFAALEDLMGRLNSQQAFLTQHLSSQSRR